ncbi:CDK5 and ABL1 enzyme substrate 2 [Camelus dromedarius]|uniref:CDK5 and ABL1 enzyme substrate 2 n=1 Tax=Camelus dromedarius TaxID=9838 RepID=A0A5N4E3P7_CAMDR|nr:CDK5 and ABL1 enzyme substrate 2 [Camelus dromedarius]
MNETFQEKFPHIRLTLSKIRSLKQEPVMVSMAYMYCEKLVLQGKLNKQTHKLCVGTCMLLAAKISSNLCRNDVKQLISKLEERFQFNRRDLIGFEFTVLVALELALYLLESQCCLITDASRSSYSLAHLPLHPGALAPRCCGTHVGPGVTPGPAVRVRWPPWLVLLLLPTLAS